MAKKIDLGLKILEANDLLALKNVEFFAKKNILCFNMISSPGSGKTTILEQTILRLRKQIRIGVIEGDVETDIDAQRIKKTKAPAIQIETKGGCHLSADQIAKCLKKLPTDKLDLIFIENVGNLVCPTAFELGESSKIAVLSVAEGDDKPIKYPEIFAISKVLLINKIDLLKPKPMVDFNLNKVIKYVKKINRDIIIFELSAKTGLGFDKWCNWLKKEMDSLK